MSKLISYVIAVFAIFASLELVVSYNEGSFFALSDKLLLKLEILKKREGDKLVFIGSSRTLDAVDAKTFDRKFRSLSGLEMKSFNAATTGQNIERFLYNLEEVLKNESAKTVVVESSAIGLKDGDLGFDLKKKERVEEAPKTTEEKLQSWMHDNFVSVRVRKAFKPKIFLRLFMIWTADTFNHDMWFRSNTLKQISSGFFKDYSDEIFNQHKGQAYLSGESGDIQDIKLARLVELLKRYNKKVIFYSPPITRVKNAEDCNKERQMDYKRIASSSLAIVLDYSCGELAKEFYRDPTHLNPNGRVFFSQLLAKDIWDLKEQYSAL